MGSCFSRPQSGGQRLSSASNSPRAGTTSVDRPNPNSQEERERRAAAADERLNASKTRGTSKSGGGALSKKLEQEQASGGTGARGESNMTRGQESEIRRWD
ncbi:unnamed protein product [Sympodiomycopsis kandeliae]